MINPWGQEKLSAERAVLLALSITPQNASQIASKIELPQSEVRTALERLTEASLAIREGDEYELTGPLSWFGDFQGALEHYARKNFLLTVPGESESHLYVSDIRIKGARPVGDPLTETSSVLGCGRTERNVAPAVAPPGAHPTCRDCAAAARFRADRRASQQP